MKKTIIFSLIFTQIMYTCGASNKLTYPTTLTDSDVPVLPYTTSLYYPASVSETSSWWQESLTYIIEHPWPFLIAVAATVYAYLHFATNKEEIQDDIDKQRNETEEFTRLRENVTTIFESVATSMENNADTINNVSSTTKQLFDGVLEIANHLEIINKRLGNLGNRDEEYKQQIENLCKTIQLIREVDEAYRQHHASVRNPVKYVLNTRQRRADRRTKQQKREELRYMTDQSSSRRASSSASVASSDKPPSEFMQPNFVRSDLHTDPRMRWQQSGHAIIEKLRSARRSKQPSNTNMPRIVEKDGNGPIKRTVPLEKQEARTPDTSSPSSLHESQEQQIMSKTVERMRQLSQRSEAIRHAWHSDQENDT